MVEPIQNVEDIKTLEQGLNALRIIAKHTEYVYGWQLGKISKAQLLMYLEKMQLILNHVKKMVEALP